MNNDIIADIISQMTPGQLKEFINEDLPRLVGRMFWYHGQTDDDKKKIAIKELSKAIANPTMEATQESVIGSLRKYVSPEVEQPQQSRSANVTGYSFDDDSYNAIAGEYDDYDTYDDRVPSTRNQGSAIQSQSVSQAPLDIAGVKKAIEQDPNWQPRNDYEKWAVGFLQGEEWTPNPTVTPANVNRNTGVPTPKAPNEKYQFNVLEDRENRTANVKNIPIPKPVGIRTDLQTGLVYDYNQGLVFNPATGVTQKMLTRGLVPTSRTIPDVIQGEPSNFVPVPPIESRLDLDPNQDLSPQARQYLVDRQWNKDKEQAYIQQQQAVDNQLTSGENRFFGTANFSPKRDYSIPDEYKRFIGTSPRIAQVNQAYSPEVMSRVGQGGFLNNTGSILLPQTWIDKETGDTVFSRGRGTATTIVYKGDKEGNAIPSISIPRVEGSGNELVSFEDAVKRQLITPEQYDNYINQAAQTRFIPASGMDSFNRENVKLYEATDNSGNNYRATYMNPLTKEVFNVTRNGGFYLVRPGVSDEASGLPTYDDTTNLAQEMTDINRGMREGGRDNLVDIIREDPDNPGLEAFTRPVPAINPITGETINKYVHSRLEERFNPATGQIEKTYVDTRTPFKWTNENNPEDLFNYFNANVEGSGQSMEALDSARGGRRTAGGKVTSAYPSLQETDYLGGRLGFNAEGNIVDVPSQELGAKGINSLTPSSEFYSSSPQVVRQLVVDPATGKKVPGKVIYDPNRTVYVKTGSTGDFAVVPYKEDRYQKTGSYQVSRPIYAEKQNLSLNQGSRRIADVNNSTLLADVPESLQSTLPFLGKGNPNPPIVYLPANLQVSRQQTIEGYEPGEVDVFQPYSVYPGDFTNTQFYRFKTNPETPLRAFNVNEYGVPIPNSYGFPQEVLNSKGEPIDIPRSAQIANKAEFISQPRLMVQDFKGVTPDYQPVPDGMSYEEADRKGLLNPIFNARTVGLNSSYQIPLPKGVGLARVLDESDPRTQAAITAQTKAEARIAADTTIVKPALDRKYTITPGRIAGIESPQYGQYMDLTPNVNDTNAGWEENIPGVVPKGVIEGAYLPVTVTPRTTLAGGKQGFLKANKVYTTESGRRVQGQNANTFASVPLNLDSVATSYLPKSKREELELKGFSGDEIDDWVKANPNLARDNALANAKILIDGQYYDVTPQATVPEFNPAAGGNYLQAVNRSEHRGARIDLPFKAGKNISEPTPEWIAEQAAKGNLAFNPDDYISPDDKAILDQKEVYNAGYEEPTDILGAINRTQQKKNRIDAVISNREQRSVPRIQQLSADELRRKSQELDVAIDYAMQTNQKGLGLKLAGQKAQLDLLSISTQQSAMDNLNKQVGSVIDGNYTTLSPGMKVFNRDILSSPGDLSSPIHKELAGSVELIHDVQTPVNKTFKGWQNYSNYLGDEIARASAAYNAIIGIEDAPEIVIKREGSPQQLEAFLSTANNVLGMGTKDDSFRYRNNPDEKLTASVVGSLPIRYLPYEQAQELNETKLYHPNDIETIAANRDLTPAQVKSLENARLLPAYRTQQKVELSTVPTSNIMNLGRVIPFPEEVITTQQFIPAGNQVVNIANSDGVAIVPSSSEKYQYRSGANANDDPWDIVDNSALGMMGGMGFDGGSIPGDDIPRQVRTNVQQRVQAEPNVRTSRTQSPNTPIEPDVRMTGMKIPKWAIPATLGAVWLGLAANARRQQDEERRQQQSIGIR